MSGNHENRVLNRMGARELSPEEVDKITGTGGDAITLLSVRLTSPASNPDRLLDT